MEALYRKYRPSTFADVVGQEHIERTLKNAIEQDKVSHAYLFCGPRGTGKTTTARILAKALMCEKGPTIEPDGTCPECVAIAQGTHPDVYELDAASRTGVENVREEIISRVSYAPTRGAWKVYIIDEVHMLSTAAFNALLKTIEEPPSHVVFILCTTDPQKVPETILSRCQRFDFHRISIESIVARLGTVCAKEGVEFEAEALDLIAHRAEGGMRNALTSLEQLIAYCGGKATLEGAQSLLGSLDNADLSEIVEAIGRRDAVACFNWVAQYVETGADLAQFVRDLAEHIRTLYLLSMAGLDVELQISESMRTVMAEELKLFGQDRLSRMLIVLGDVSKELRISSNPRLSFEIALTRMIRPESDLTLESLAERIEQLEMRLAGLASAPAPSVPVAQPAAPAQPQPAVPVPARPTQPAAPAPRTQPQNAVPGAAAPKAAPAAFGMSSGVAGSSAVPAAVQAPAAVAQPAAHPEQPNRVPAPAQPMQASSAVPAAVPAAQPQAPVAAPVPQTASAQTLTAQVDLTNPAAVQRLWHSVTAALRKVNPARGVLFMNAKVSADANGQGIVVEFGKDSAFAFNAAQKTEVQELLAQTIKTVAGGTVPYRLALAGGGASAAPAPTPSAAAPAQPAVGAAAIKNPYAAKAVAAVRAAQAQAQASAASSTQAAPAQASPVAQSYPSQGAAASQTRPAKAQPQVGARTQTAPATAQPYAQTGNSQQPAAPRAQAPSAPEPYDDQVPLDVYGASIPEEYDEDPYAQPAYGQPVPAQSSAAVPAGRQVYPSQPPTASVAGQAPYASSRSAGASSGSRPEPAAPPYAQPVSAQSGIPFQVPASQAASASSAQGGGASASSQESAGGGSQNDAERIKSILTNSFGEGIKFEELPN